MTATRDTEVTNRGIVLPGEWVIELAERPTPLLQDGEVLVQICVSGVCGSDLHMAAFSPEENSRLRVSSVFGGHEAAGVIVATTPEDSLRSVGERVLVYHYEACWECMSCRAGFLQWCRHRRALSMERDGSFARYLVVDGRNCLLLPDDFSFEDGASIACSAGTAVAAVLKLSDHRPRSPVVIGLGPVGLAIAQILRAEGSDVIGVDLQAARRDFALKADLVTEVREGIPTEPTFSTVFEVTGSDDARRAALLAVDNGGEIIFVGMQAAETALPIEELILRETTVRGSNIWPITLYDHIITLYRRLGIRPGALRMEDQSFNLDHGEEALQTARFAAGKVFIYPRSTD